MHARLRIDVLIFAGEGVGESAEWGKQLTRASRVGRTEVLDVWGYTNRCRAGRLFVGSFYCSDDMYLASCLIRGMIPQALWNQG